MMAKQDYYEVLGVEKGANAEALKKRLEQRLRAAEAPAGDWQTS